MTEGIKYDLLRFLDKNREFTQKDVARYCGVSAQTLSYNILIATRCDEGLEKNIQKFLEKNGVHMQNLHEKNEIIKDEVLEFACLMSHELEMLIKITGKGLRSDIVSPQDRADLLKRIKTMRTNINEQIDSLIEMAQG
jgi:hypothetical protein